MDVFVPSEGNSHKTGFFFGADNKLYVSSNNGANGWQGSIVRYDAITGNFLDTFVTPCASREWRAELCGNSTIRARW